MLALILGVLRGCDLNDCKPLSYKKTGVLTSSNTYQYESGSLQAVDREVGQADLLELRADERVRGGEQLLQLHGVHLGSLVL